MTLHTQRESETLEYTSLNSIFTLSPTEEAGKRETEGTEDNRRLSHSKTPEQSSYEFPETKGVCTWTIEVCTKHFCT